MACKKLLEQDPNSEIGIALLGNCLAKQGEIAAAIEHFDRALAIKPDYETAITTKIFALDFVPDADFALHQAARRSWWDAIGARIPRRTLRPRQFDPHKQIVIGYVSSDFRDHSAALAFMPVLRRHDHANLRIICYSCSPVRDAVTTEAESLADAGWMPRSFPTMSWRIGSKPMVSISLSTCPVTRQVIGLWFSHVSQRRFRSVPGGIRTGTGLPTIDYIFADPVSIPEHGSASVCRKNP